jgi:hypothetical protein
MSIPMAVDEVDRVLELRKVCLENMMIVDGYQNLWARDSSRNRSYIDDANPIPDERESVSMHMVLVKREGHGFPQTNKKVRENSFFQ